MSVRALVLVVAIGSLLGARDVCAEKVKTNQETKVRAKPGEQEKVLLKLKSGQTMTVLSKDGRWLKVRVQGRTGYVPRSTVDMPDDDEIVRNTRRRPFVDGRSTKRGFGGEQGPDDRVGADATGDNADDSDSSGGGKASAKAASKTSSSSDDDDDDSSPPAKGKAKPAAKASVKVASAAKSSKSEDDDDDDSSPTPKAKAKANAKAATSKAAVKTSDDDDDDDDASASGKSKSSSSSAKKKKTDDDSDDDTKVEDDDKGDGGKARPTAHVSAKAVAYNEHDQESGEAFTARPADVLYPGETKGKWTFVETDDGDAGWVLSSQLDVDGGDLAGGPRRRTIGLGANLGVTFIQQALTSVGTSVPGFPDKYTVGTSAFSVGVGGDVLFPYGNSLLFGGGGTFEYSLSAPGIYVPPMGTATSGTNTGVTLDNLNLRGTVGYDLHKGNGITVFGRLGYRYQAFLVNGNSPTFDPAKNPAKLPSETTQGATIGAALDIPRLTSKIGINVALDAMLGASVKQTTDLDDGTKPSATLYAFDAGAVYHWKKAMDLQAAYMLGLGSYNFGAPDPSSLRMHMGTDTKRTDVFNTVTIGIARGF